jgi:hypothetical protein
MGERTCARTLHSVPKGRLKLRVVQFNGMEQSVSLISLDKRMRGSTLGNQVRRNQGCATENSGKPNGAPLIPPLRYAPAGMTIHPGNYP